MKGVRRPAGFSDSDSSGSEPEYGSNFNMADAGGREMNKLSPELPPTKVTAVQQFGIGRGLIPHRESGGVGMPEVRSRPRGRGRVNNESRFYVPPPVVRNQAMNSATTKPRFEFAGRQNYQNSVSRPPSGATTTSSGGMNNSRPIRANFSISTTGGNNKADTYNHQSNGPRNPGGSIPVLHSGSRNNSITENIKVSQSRVNNPNSQTSTSLHVPFLNADTAPNYIDIHAMMKAAQIESIPFLDTVKAEISYRAIKQAWNTARTEELVSQCRTAYLNSEHPLCLGLFFMLRSCDFTNPMGNRSLCTSVILELQKFLAHSNSTDWKSQLSYDIKKLAFHLVLTYRKLDLKHLITEVFKIREIKDDLIQDIQLLSKQCLFKQALAGSLVLEVFTFDIHTFIIPMILQDKLISVEEYFDNKGARQLLVNTITFLDKIVASNRSNGNWWYNYACERKIDIKTILQDKLNVRTLTKLVKRLCNKYNVDSTSTPNISKQGAAATLRYILWRRFTEDSSAMTDENFQDIVVGLIKDDYTLTEEAMYQIKINAGIDYAAEFAKLHSVPHEWLPSDVLHKLGNAPIKVDKSWADEEDWETDQEPVPTSSQRPVAASCGQQFTNAEVVAEKEPRESTVALPEKISDTKPQSCSSVSYYSLPIGLDKVKSVATLEEFQFFIQHLRRELLTKKQIFIGVDAEWRPWKSKSASILQIAFRQQYVFLVDLLNLGKFNDNGVSPFLIILTEFFAEEKVIKLSYDFRNDFSMLLGASPHWSALEENSRSIFDLKTLQIEIQKRHAQFFPYSEVTSAEKGLKELVQICCNKSLDKAEQISDWERRPLRNTQILYAAVDAYVLTEIFNVITERDKIFPVQLDNFVKACQKQTALSLGKHHHKKLKVPVDVVHAVFDAIGDKETDGIKNSLNSAQILCDQMLEGLGRLLRCFGVNTILIGPEVNHQEMVASAKAQGTLIITRGKTRYNEFLRDFPPEQVLYVKSDVYVDQVLEVFRYFNIKPERQHCHTVCFYCNNSVFIEASKPLIQGLVERRGYKKSTRCTQQALEKVTRIIPPEMMIDIGDNKPRNWRHLLREETIIIRQAEDRAADIAFTSTDAHIEINKVPPHLLDSYLDEFYICNFCGAFYWSSKVIENMIYAKQQSSDSSEDG